MANDDKDMKIVGMEKKREEPDPAGRYELQKDNGNLTRAFRLGLTLCGELGKDSEKDDADIQSRILKIFSIITAVERLLPDDLLVRTTLNVLYDQLKKEEPALYDTMSSSGAFTLYYLELRRREDSDEEIARVYAKLSGAENDPERIAKGVDILRTNFEFTKKLVKKLAFVF